MPQSARPRLNKAFVKEDIGSAIIQARDYCRKKSIPFAMVTNGDQWIIFPACRTDGVSFEESTAIIFENIEDVLINRIEYFKSLVSRKGFLEENLKIELLGRTIDQIEDRRLNKFFKGSSSNLNPVYPFIESEITLAFSDSLITADAELLEKCYVSNSDRQKFDQKIQMHLQKKEALFSKNIIRPLRPKESKLFNKKIEGTSKLNRPLAILLLGSVGSGKSTFLEYTYKVASQSFFSETNEYNPQWIKIDFRNYSAQENSLDFIYNNIFEVIIDENYPFNDKDKVILKAYHQEIEALKKGPLALFGSKEEIQNKIAEKIYSDYQSKKPYIDKLLKFYSSKSPVFVVIDNVDQFESEEVQSTIFSNSIAFAGKLNINLIIAMRESTYINHRNSPTFDAFDFDPILIEPPEISSVISKRFTLAEQLLQGKKCSFTSLNGAKFDVNNLADFISLTKSSVLGTEIGNKIDVLANHDVRLALRMTREFLANGYTDPAKAINFHQTGKPYKLPPHEAFRSILLGNRSVYDESFSVIGNPLDSKLNQNNSELLRLFILAGLVRQYSLNSSVFITAEDIKNALAEIGFKEDIVLQVLKDLCEKRFIHTKSHKIADMQSSFYPSRLGGHVIKILLSDLAFIENILMDTFISDNEIWHQLKQLSEQILNERSNIVKRLKIRIERVQTFYSYMKKLYSPLLEQAQIRNLETIWLTNPLEEAQKDLYENCERAISRATQNYG